MTSLDPIKLQLCLQLIKKHLENGDSLTLSKVKAMRAAGIDEAYGFLITANEEYRTMKEAFRKLHRFGENWKLEMN